MPHFIVQQEGLMADDITSKLDSPSIATESEAPQGSGTTRIRHEHRHRSVLSRDVMLEIARWTAAQPWQRHEHIETLAGLAFASRQFFEDFHPLFAMARMKTMLPSTTVRRFPELLAMFRTNAAYKPQSLEKLLAQAQNSAQPSRSGVRWPGMSTARGTDDERARAIALLGCTLAERGAARMGVPWLLHCFRALVEVAGQYPPKTGAVAMAGAGALLPDLLCLDPKKTLQAFELVLNQLADPHLQAVLVDTLSLATTDSSARGEVERWTFDKALALARKRRGEGRNDQAQGIALAAAVRLLPAMPRESVQVSLDDLRAEFSALPIEHWMAAAIAACGEPRHAGGCATPVELFNFAFDVAERSGSSQLLPALACGLRWLKPAHGVRLPDYGQRESLRAGKLASAPIRDRCTALVALLTLSRGASKDDLGAFVHELARSLPAFKPCGDWSSGLFDKIVSTLPQLHAKDQVDALGEMNTSLWSMETPIEAGSMARVWTAVEPLLSRLANDHSLRVELERQLRRLMQIVPQFLKFADIDQLPAAMRQFKR
jgi:hypothetical protein